MLSREGRGRPWVAGAVLSPGMVQAWDTLASRSESPFCTPDWAVACQASVECEPFFVTADGEGAPRAIAPLALRGGVVPRLELIGMREAFEPMDLVAADAQALRCLARRIVDAGAPVLLGRIPEGSPTIEALRGAFRRGRGAVFVHPVASTPHLTLERCDAEPERRLNAGRRSDLRRMVRRASAMGPVCFERHTPAPNALPGLLEEALRVEAAGWKGRAGTALVHDPLRGRLLRCFAARAAEKRRLIIEFLRIDGRLAAMHLAVEWNRRYWLLKIGYDELYGRCSPGVLLLRESIRDAAARGCETYELLGAPEPWLRPWTDGERRYVAVRAYPARLRGLAALGADVSRLLRKRPWQEAA